MDKVRVSKAMNRWTGGEDELLCYRIYIQARLQGGLWLGWEGLINVTFFVIRRERNHVKMNHRWQEREYDK